MRCPKLAFGLFILALSGCGFAATMPVRNTTPVQPAHNSATAPATPQTVKALPFTGRLTQGDPAELPPIVAASLSAASPVTFVYREQLTHDEHHIPLAVSAFDPVTYIGAPLGDYGVSAFATLTISCGDAVLGDYQANAFVTKSYNLYSEPTHHQLEDAARRAVRAKLDAQISRDTPRLARAVRASDTAAISPAVN